MPILLDLFLSFARIGLFTFGGGYAMISIIEDTCINKKKWITHDDMMNVSVIAESTPGPISVNCATFVGYQQAGIIGAICSTLGVVLPSFVIIFLISMFLENFLEFSLVAKAFDGIRVAVGILIINAGINMVKKIKKKTVVTVGILISTCLVMLLINFFKWNFSSIVLMLLAGLFNLIYFSITNSIEKRKVGKSK